MCCKCKIHTEFKIKSGGDGWPKRPPHLLGTGQGFLPAHFTQHSTGDFNSSIRQQKEIKGINIRMKEIILSLFTNKIISVKNLQTLELMNEFGKITR